MVFILESKLEVVSDVVVGSLWPTDSFEFVFAPSLGASGGIIIIWDSIRFVIESSDLLPHVGGLWLQLGAYLESHADVPWCVAGDFNAIRGVTERKGCQVHSQSMTAFSEFGELNRRTKMKPP
ncbi:hypothetical protein GQ457_05G018960 [Hibiscus cannabinus]